MEHLGLILIHGLGGNFDEVAPLANFLRLKGFPVTGVALKGHTGRRIDLVRPFSRLDRFRRNRFHRAHATL